MPEDAADARDPSEWPDYQAALRQGRLKRNLWRFAASWFVAQCFYTSFFGYLYAIWPYDEHLAVGALKVFTVLVVFPAATISAGILLYHCVKDWSDLSKPIRGIAIFIWVLTVPEIFAFYPVYQILFGARRTA